MPKACLCYVQVRSRLDTFAERDADAKAEQMHEAALQADAIAAELLAEEAKSKKGKGGKEKVAKAT